MRGSRAAKRRVFLPQRKGTGDEMNRLKKMLTVSLAAVLAAGAMTVTAAAAGTTAGTVKVGTYLNVRQAGNTGAPVIGRLSSGTRVTVLDTVNGWDKISYNGGTAWVSGVYVTLDSAGARRQTVVDAARAELGVRYVFGGASPAGFDCSGLTLFAYAKVGVTLPHSAASQAGQGVSVARSALLPGDLLFFDTTGAQRTVTHVGIYEGGGKFISAQSGAGAVKEAELSNSYWSGAYLGARRIIQ